MLQLIGVAAAGLIVLSFVLAMLAAGTALLVTGVKDWASPTQWRDRFAFDALAPIVLGVVLLAVGSAAMYGIFLLCERGCS